MQIALSKNIRKLTLVFAAAAALAGCQRYEEPVEQCARTSNEQEFQQAFPSLYTAFKKIEALPYSGRHVTAHMKDPLNGIQTCSANDLGKAAGEFRPDNGKLRMDMRVLDGRAYTHEMFHAEQYVNGSLKLIGSSGLAIEDNLQGNMLIEAAAVGYSFIVYKEMDKTEPGAYADFNTTWYSFGMRQHFDAAYAKALPQGEEKALEAGGKAVVEGLLSGANGKWSESYAERAAYNNLTSGVILERYREGYATDRAEYFRAAGAISPTINITPDWLLKENPEQNITAHLKKSGITIRYK